MEKMTHREFLLWCRYLNQSWEKPSRSDWYLMQIAALLETQITRKVVQTGSMKIVFENNEPEELSEGEVTRKAAEISKMRLEMLKAQSLGKKRRSPNPGQSPPKQDSKQGPDSPRDSSEGSKPPPRPTRRSRRSMLRKKDENENGNQ